MHQNDCLFCKITQGEVPSYKIYEDEHSFAFLDINPVSRGHTLVVPKTHAEDITNIRAEDLISVMETVRLISPKIIRALNADGFNVHINNGRAAGQVIFHSHVHIIPRFNGDNLPMWNHSQTAQLEEVFTLINKEI